MEVSAVEEGVDGVDEVDEEDEEAEVEDEEAEVAVLDHREEGTRADAVVLKGWANQDDQSSFLYFTLLVCHFTINTTTRHPSFPTNSKTSHLQVMLCIDA